MRLRPVWTLIVLALWLLLTDASWGNAGLGLALGLLLPALAGPLLPEEGPGLKRPWLLVPYAGVVAWDILRASVTVTRLVLFLPRAAFRPAWVAVPLTGLDQPGAVTILAGTVTLTPGTLSADISPDGRHLLVHCLHAPDPATVAAEITTRYTARLRRIFG